MSQDFPYLEDQVADRSTLFPHKDIHLVGAMGAFYGTLIGFHPDLAAEIVRRYQALDERHSVLFVGVDDDEESAAARRLLERGGKFEVIVRPVGQRDELVNALSKAAGTLHDLKNNWPLDELHEPIEATIDRACTLIPGLKEELA